MRILVVLAAVLLAPAAPAAAITSQLPAFSFNDHYDCDPIPGTPFYCLAGEAFLDDDVSLTILEDRFGRPLEPGLVDGGRLLDEVLFETLAWSAGPATSAVQFDLFLEDRPELGVIYGAIGPAPDFHGAFQVTFRQPIDALSLMATNGGPDLRIETYDPDGALLGVVAEEAQLAGSGFQSQLTWLANPGYTMSRFVVLGDPAYFVIQHIQYRYARVPEPATWLLLGIGLVGIAALAEWWR